MTPAEPTSPSPSATLRLRLQVQGLVQGVGFRPFVFRLASNLGLTGFVRNSPAGALLEVEGAREAIAAFRHRLEADRPMPCEVVHLESTWLEPTGRSGFEILPSDTAGVRSAVVLPDLATCPQCLQELRNPRDRRHRYPFTNCTRCGPRFSIIESIPYDRARTSMRGFPLCPQCRAEYENPADRRFHAEPVACPECGPQVVLWDCHGRPVGVREPAIGSAVELLRDGAILAVKGLGGFQLLVRADHESGVRRLRQRKRREAKPLAVMAPSLEAIHACCQVSPDETQLLTSAAAPIVLLARHPLAASGPAPSVAPGSPWLGVMLPYTPLHHLLLGDLDLIVVATSGNLSDEPICIDEHEALQRLGGLADFFLVHNRPIVRPVDDSVARVVLGTEQILRRARGYAPLPILLPSAVGTSPPLIALGAQLKNAIAIARGREVFLGPHIGDLETAEAAEAFDRAAADLPQLLDLQPEVVATDAHPDYFATQRGAALPLPRVSLFHHEAHAFACLADNDLPLPALALAWDGTGLGPDGTIWGGECLELTADACHRRAWFQPFRLPGGDRAARDPRRSALGMIHEAGLEKHPAAQAYLDLAFHRAEQEPIRRALERGVNAPWTSSLGRLFDGIASLLGLTQTSRFEGEAAMLVESAAWRALPGQAPPPPPPPPIDLLTLEEAPSGWVLDWRPFLLRLLDSDVTNARTIRKDDGPPRVSPLAQAWAIAWHVNLSEAVVKLARRLQPPRILLTGGCFQNRLLTEATARALREAGFAVHWHQRIPPNDGGIAVGQAAAAALRWNRTSQPPPPQTRSTAPCALPSPGES